MCLFVPFGGGKSIRRNMEGERREIHLFQSADVAIGYDPH
jgi:hypothetical protein